MYAESPSTLIGLWKQRTRWARGLLQSLRVHQDLAGSTSHGMFGPFLVYTVITMVAMPLLQLVVLAILIVALAAGVGAAATVPIQTLLVAGVGMAAALTAFAIVLDRSPRDLLHLWTIPLWPLFSVFLSAAFVHALVLEIRGAENRWNKLERTGVVSVPHSVTLRS